MLKSFARAALALTLFAAPAMARDGVDYGRNETRNAPSRHNRSGAWIGNNLGHHGGRHWGSHDHFSPRGQGGHHWGW